MLCPAPGPPLGPGSLGGSRWEIHDEELLQNASQTLEEKAEELPVRDLCEVIYAVTWRTEIQATQLV